MKLYDVKQRSGVRVRVVEPDWPEDMQDEVFVFSHIDGMYSYCTRTNGDPIHLGATTEVEVIHE